jgi:hypothetical protein
MALKKERQPLSTLAVPFGPRGLSGLGESQLLQPISFKSDRLLDGGFPLK